jgi:hypothetical protein
MPPPAQELVVEEVDAVIVAEPRALPERRPPGQLVKAQAAVAAGSFVAGAATAVVVAHRRAKKASRRTGRGRRGGAALEVAASRSFLVDVHLLQKRP